MSIYEQLCSSQLSTTDSHQKQQLCWCQQGAVPAVCPAALHHPWEEARCLHTLLWLSPEGSHVPWLFIPARKIMCRSLPFQLPPLSHLHAVHAFRNKIKQGKTNRHKTTKNPLHTYLSAQEKVFFCESKFKDIYPKLFKPRNPEQAYFHSPSSEPGLDIIPQLPGKGWNLLAQSSSVLSSCPRWYPQLDLFFYGIWYHWVPVIPHFAHNS